MDQNGKSSRWDPSASLNYVLTPQPDADNEDEFGSHMAFVRIQQHVDRFDELVCRMAAATGKTDDEVKGWIMGRTQDGRPAAGDTATTGGEDLNDFNFEDDAKFEKCPAAANIRKVNPRSSHVRNHRLLRRGVLYGSRDQECGTLFQCFQSKLETRFERVFEKWAMGTDHPQSNCGQDAVLGARDCPPMPAGFSPGSAVGPFDIRSVTTVRYGEYFFFPSIPFFRRLGQQAASTTSRADR